MSILLGLIIISSLSFFGYAINYFIFPDMKAEFERFGLSKLGLLTIILQILGALGLLVGLIINPILILSSGGLALMMFIAVLTRIKVKDKLLVCLPAIFFLFLNSYILFESIKFFQLSN